MFQGKQKIMTGIMLPFLLVVIKLYMISTGDTPYLLHEKAQYVGLNASVGRVNYTNNDKLVSEVDNKTKKQLPEVMEQGIIKQKSEEVKQSVK